MKVTIRRSASGWDVLVDGALWASCRSRREAQYEQDMARLRFTGNSGEGTA